MVSPFILKKRQATPTAPQLFVVSNNWRAVQPRLFVHKKQRQEEKGSKGFLAPDPW